MTISHLRFGRKPIRSSYLISRASFVACHQFSFLERIDVLRLGRAGRDVSAEQSLWRRTRCGSICHARCRTRSSEKRLRFFVIDAYRVAKDNGMGGRINTVMQTCFFALSKVLPRDEAIAAIKHAIEKTYGKRGEAVVQKNFAAVDDALAHLAGGRGSTMRLTVRSTCVRPFPADAPEFVQHVLGAHDRGRRRRVASERAAGGRHLSHRHVQMGETQLSPGNSGMGRGAVHSVRQVRAGLPACGDPLEAVLIPKDCRPPPAASNRPRRAGRTGNICATCCRFLRRTARPAACAWKSARRRARAIRSHKAVNMAPQAPIREQEKRNWDFFLSLPEFDRSALSVHNVKDIQLLQPLFEFPGACAGCGETPYIKLLTQLFGDRLVIANATGCSSIYGGNLPTTPYTVNGAGRGPAWSNSLFEDNAEFGLGLRVSLDKQAQYARELVERLRNEIGEELAAGNSGCRSVQRGGHPEPSGIASLTWSGGSLQSTALRRGTCGRSPARWFARASGRWVATAGPTTSASAAWIMCSPPAAT